MSETAVLHNKVKEQKPLVHHITNWVTIYDCANIVRSVGALPVMAHAIEEAGDMAKIASALVLNIGTLTSELIESMKIAGKAANEKGIPIVLDAVGVGATRLRDDKALELLNELKINIIKGNASEIAKLSGENVQTKGVESTKVERNLIEVASKLAKERKSTVVITGKEDIITDGSDVYLCNNGSAMMGSVVGTGCMAASVIGAYAAVEKDYAKAASSALAVFGIAAELAERNSFGPGTFKEHLYDEIFNLDDRDINEMVKLEKKTIKKENTPVNHSKDSKKDKPQKEEPKISKEAKPKRESNAEEKSIDEKQEPVAKIESVQDAEEMSKEVETK